MSLLLISRQWLGFLGRGVESLQKLDSLYSGQEEDDLEGTTRT